MPTMTLAEAGLPSGRVKVSRHCSFCPGCRWSRKVSQRIVSFVSGSSSLKSADCCRSSPSYMSSSETPRWWRNRSS